MKTFSKIIILLIIWTINCPDLFSSVTWTETVKSTSPPGGVYFSNVLYASSNTAQISHIYWVATSSSPTGLIIKVRADENDFSKTSSTPAWETVSLGCDPVSSGRYMQYCASFTYVSTITALNYIYITYYSTAQTEITPPAGWNNETPTGWINNLTPDVTIDISDSDSGLRVKGTGTGEIPTDYEYKKDTTSTAGYWHFNETEGLYAVDYSTNFRLGVLGGGNTDYTPTSTEGIPGYNQSNKALQFDGQNDYIVINDTSAFDYRSDSSFTIECWIKVLATGSNQRILQKLQGQFGYEGGCGYFFMIGGSGAVGFSIFNWGTARGVTTSSALSR